MNKKELKERVEDLVGKLGDTWQGTKSDFMKFVSKNKRTIKKAAITGSVFALSALMTACSMGVEKTDGKVGLYVDFGGRNDSSQSPTQDPNGAGKDSIIFGGDGEDWSNDATEGAGNDYYDSNLNNPGISTEPTTPSLDPTNPTTPSIDPTSPSTPSTPGGWYDDGLHFGGDNNGSSSDTTSPTDPTNPSDFVEPTNPTTPSVSTGGAPMDNLLSEMMGENVKVISVEVALDSNGDVLIWDMENGVDGQAVELKCKFQLCDENGNLIPLKGGESPYVYTLHVSREAYNKATGGKSITEVSGSEIDHIFGKDFVEQVAGELGVALPTDYSKGGM